MTKYITSFEQMLSDVIIWILEIILDDEFYPSLRTAWEELFQCLKAMLDSVE